MDSNFLSMAQMVAINDKRQRSRKNGGQVNEVVVEWFCTRADPEKINKAEVPSN